MKPIIQTLLLTLAIYGSAVGQTTPATTSFTLDDCIRYALENTIDVKNARVDQEIYASKVKETTGLGLPQIDGSVSLQHNQKLPRFFSYYSTAKGFAGTNDDGTPKLDLPGVADNDVVASPNFFQLPSSGTAGLTVNQLLFSTTYLIGLKAASTYKELASRSAEETQIQVVQKVMKAYYSVLINKERLAMYDHNIERVDSLLRNTKALNQNGFAEAIDVDRTQVRLNNLKSDRLKVSNLETLGIYLLKYQMNYPMEKDISIAGKLDDITLDEDLFDAYANDWDYKKRIEYKKLDTQRKLLQLDVKNKYSTAHPSLNGFWNLGYSTQSPNITGIFKTNTAISDNGFVGPDKWYGYSLYGVTLKVPLFSGLQRNYQIQQAKLTLLKTENSFVQLQQMIDLSIYQNGATYKNAIATYKTQEENMELAQKVARITKIKYEQGVGSNIEVIDAENSLRESQVNFYNALFDAVTAKTDLDVAYAKIDPSKYQTATR
ncbi:MAG: TolC family protein [Chryseolinea sp.]